MNKRELLLLEKAFNAEIGAALSGSGVHLIQTRSKLALKLVEDGMLAKKTVNMGGRFPMTINGFELTELGRMIYCMNCEGA